MASELDKLQGTWRVTSFEADGQNVPMGATDATITIEGDRFTSSGMGDAYSGTFVVSPRKRPKTFDLVFTSGSPAGKRNRGIYKLDGDTWTICLSTREGPRPRSFKTKPDSGLALETLRRASASDVVSKSSNTTPAQAADAEPAGIPTEIEGEWQMESAVFDGKPLAPDMIRWCKRVTRGNVTQVFAGPRTMLDASFTLDSERGQIDYVLRAGEDKGKSQAGIYDVRDGRLRICMAAPGKKRPGDFASIRGDGRSFTVWQLMAR